MAFLLQNNVLLRLVGTLRLRICCVMLVNPRTTESRTSTRTSASLSPIPHHLVSWHKPAQTPSLQPRDVKKRGHRCMYCTRTPSMLLTKGRGRNQARVVSWLFLWRRRGIKLKAGAAPLPAVSVRLEIPSYIARYEIRNVTRMPGSISLNTHTCYCEPAADIRNAMTMNKGHGL